MILREPGSTQPGSYLAFLVRIQTVDPSAFEMPVAPGKRSRGFFIFEGELQDVRYWHKADILSCTAHVRSTPNLSDLIIDCAAKFLRYALNLLPRIGAILAFEREDIDYAKQAEEKDKTKEKLAHA